MVGDIGHKLRASASREQGRAKTWRKYAVWFPCFRHREIPTWGFATRGNQSAPLRQRRGDQTEHLRQFFRRRSAYSRPAPSDVPPEPGRAARARSRIGRELRVPAKPERIMGGLRKSASGAEVRLLPRLRTKRPWGRAASETRGKMACIGAAQRRCRTASASAQRAQKKKRPGGGGRRARRRGDATLSGAAFCFSETKQASDRRGLSHLLGSV